MFASISMGWDENKMVKELVYMFHGFYVLNTILVKAYR